MIMKSDLEWIAAAIPDILDASLTKLKAMISKMLFTFAVRRYGTQSLDSSVVSGEFVERSCLLKLSDRTKLIFLAFAGYASDSQMLLNLQLVELSLFLPHYDSKLFLHRTFVRTKIIQKIIEGLADVRNCFCRYAIVENIEESFGILKKRSNFTGGCPLSMDCRVSELNHCVEKRHQRFVEGLNFRAR